MIGHDPFRIPDERICRQDCRWRVALLSPDWVAADFQHGGQLNQLRLVLVGVVLAEQEFCSGGQLGADPCSSAASIAPISPSQFWTGQRRVHGFSVLPSPLSQMTTLLAVFTAGLPAVSFLTPPRCLKRQGKMAV
jgi:hypothetical protein